MPRSSPSLSLLLPLAALPLALLFPPTVHPLALPTVLLLLAPALVHAARFGARPSPALVSVLAGGMLVTWTFASSRHAAAVALLVLIGYAAAWTCGRGLGARDSRALLWLLAGAGSLAAVHGLFQVAWGFQRSLAEARALGLSPDVLSRLASARAFSRFPLPSQLGALLLLTLPVTARLGFDAWSGGRAIRMEDGEVGRLRGALPIVLAVLVCIQAAGLVATLSLGAFLAGGLGSAFFAGTGRVRGRVLAPAAVLLAVAVALAFALRPDLSGTAAGSDPVRLRIGNWKVALEMLRDHPLAGVGPGGYGVRYPRYMEEGMNETRYAHSVPLQAAAEGGAWVLLPLGLAALALARRARACGGVADRLMGAGVLGFAAANLWDFHLYLPSLGIPFLLVGGWWMTGHEEASSSRLGSSCALAGVAALVLGAVFASAATARQAVVRSAMAAGDAARAEISAASWVRVAPWDAEPRAVLGTLASQGEEGPAGAERFLYEAASLDPYTPFRRDALAGAYIRNGDLAGAFCEVDRARDLFPLEERYATERRMLLEALSGPGPR